MESNKKYLVFNLIDGSEVQTIVEADSVYDAIVQSTFPYLNQPEKEIQTGAVYELKENLIQDIIETATQNLK